MPPESKHPSSSDRRPGSPDPRIRHHYQGRKWVYTQISSQSRGLAVGVNLSPDGSCDFRCRYCDLPKTAPVDATPVNGPELARELEETFDSILSGDASRQPVGHRHPKDRPKWNHLMLSGEGEPTLCPNFNEVIETVIHVRALGRYPFFKVVLETNGSGLDLPGIRQGLDHFTAADEVWVKLDAGSAEHFRLMSGTDLPLTALLGRILGVARFRPVVIQSVFPGIDGSPPSHREISAYIQGLSLLRDQGARIQRVQIRSVSNASVASRCSHLPLGVLSEIASRVRGELGFDAHVS